MAFIIGKYINNLDLAKDAVKLREKKVYIDKNYCIGCGICFNMCSNHFKISDRKAIFIDNVDVDYNKMLEISHKCPTNAIKVNS